MSSGLSCFKKNFLCGQTHAESEMARGGTEAHRGSALTTKGTRELIPGAIGRVMKRFVLRAIEGACRRRSMLPSLRQRRMIQGKHYNEARAKGIPAAAFYLRSIAEP